MDVEYEPLGSDGTRRRPWLRALVLLLIGFVGGTVAMGYALTHWAVAARFIKTGTVTADTRPVTVVAVPAPRAPVAVIDQSAMDRRVATLEARIQAIDARADAAVGNADRAESLLVAFAARRALDRGIALGYIETLLRDRFGATQPQAVATIIGAAHQPVTLDELQIKLEEAAPQLLAHGPEENWWDGVRRELAGLVVVRRVDTPSPAPEDRLSRARSQLQAGHVDAALAEVMRMPGRNNASAWIALARRYAAARGALDAIETAALLTPRERAVAAVNDAPPVVPATAASPTPDVQPSPSAIRLSR